MPLPALRHLRPPSGWTRNGPQAPAYGPAGSAASGPTTTAIDSTSLGGRPCLLLVKHALLIYLGQAAREQENTSSEPGIGTYIGGDRLPHLICCGSNLRLAHDKVQPAPQSIRKVEVTVAASDFKTVDEYIAAQPETARVVLKRVRTTIRKALPGAVEVISYRSPLTSCVAEWCCTSLAGSSTTHSIPPTSGWSRRSKTNWHPTRSARVQSVFHFLSRSRPN